MKKSILMAYQAIIIVIMILLAGYFVSLGKIGFAVIYVLLALAGGYALRSERKNKVDRKAGTR